MGFSIPPSVAVKDAYSTVTLARDTMNYIALKEIALQNALASSDIKIDDAPGKLEELMSYMDNIDFWLNIVTP